MLRLTAKAANHLVVVRREKGHDARIFPHFVRHAGRLALTFTPKPESGDRFVETRRIATLVATSAADLLDDATIDVSTRSGTSVLVVRRGERRARPA